MSYPSPTLAPFPLSATIGTAEGHPAASVTPGNGVSYTACGSDALNALLALARKLTEAGFDAQTPLSADGISLSWIDQAL